MATKRPYDGTTVPWSVGTGTIAIVSPSGRLNAVFPKRIERAKGAFASKGFSTIEVYSPIASSMSHTEAIKHRCNELHRAFEDPEVTAIVCAIGGITAAELLPHLDYALISRYPKPFIGYSDITLLHCAFLTQAGLRTFYGPAAIPEFGDYPQPLDFTFESFLQTLTTTSFDPAAESGLLGARLRESDVWTHEFLDWGSEESSQRARKVEPAPGWKWLRAGKAQGRILGGCLPSLVQLTGTPYCPDFEGAILLLETPEGPTAPDSPFPLGMAQTCMADLRNAGVLTKVAGIVVGRPFMYSDPMRRDFEQMLVDQTYGLDHVPVLVNVDVGHTQPKITVPLGAMCELDSEKGDWKVLETPVRTRPT